MAFSHIRGKVVNNSGLICMALFIRFRHIFNEHETIAALESIITDNLGTLSEIQQLLSPEGVN